MGVTNEPNLSDARRVRVGRVGSMMYTAPTRPASCPKPGYPYGGGDRAVRGSVGAGKGGDA